MQKRRVLLVDDEKGFTSMLKLNLEASGKYEVAVENTSTQALRTALRFRPELVLLDVIMPQREGPDVANDFKGEDSLADVPIVFLTATVTQAEVDEASGSIGGNRFVAKPSSLSELMGSIDDNLLPALN